MTRVALTGGAYQARSVVASAQRQLNLYSEPMPADTGEPAAMALYPTPGLRLLTILPQGPVRGIHQATTGGLYVVAGAGVYAIAANWTANLLGSITAGLTTPVSMADNGLDLVIVDGSATGWHVTLAGNAFAAIVDSVGGFRGGGRVDYLDTFFLFSVPNTPQFQVSDSLALTFDPLYFANKEAYSDLLVSLIVAKREIWLIGSQTTEVWYNTGGADFPFQSMPGVFINRGCVAPYSVAEADNAVFWLSQDRYGAGIVLHGAGYEVSRITTYALEAEFARYPTITDAVGYTYQITGHVFYVLTFPAADKTWCYDITTKLWHELCWIDDNGTEHRHRAGCARAARNMVLAGDWQTGALYALDSAVFTDAGQPIKRARSYPHIVADGKRVIYRQFLADFDAGTAAEPRPYPGRLHRHWRIYITAVPGVSVALSLLRMLDANGVAMTGAGAATASGGTPANALTATGWAVPSSPAAPAWWAYDFGVPADIAFLGMTAIAATGPTGFTVDVSDDGTVWTRSAAISPAVWTGAEQVFPVPPT